MKKIISIILTNFIVFVLALPVMAEQDKIIQTNSSLKNSNGFVKDEIIVKFKEDNKPFRIIKVPQGKAEEKVKEYSGRKDVEYAELNYIAHALMVPNDSYYNYQWHLDNPNYGGVQAEEAWDISTGSGVDVAILDTGIRQGSDLANTCFKSGYDFVDNDSNAIDENGHGTHIAGTVAQSTNNNTGVAGLSFDACLMPVRVLDKNGSGSHADIADGIIWAADQGAKVINLSLGGPVGSITLENALAYAYNHGVTIVAAAGNEGSNILSYPAAYNDYVIAVGATRYDETLAYYSNYGPGVDVVAPGGDLTVDQNYDGYADGVLQQTFEMRGKRIKWGYYFFQGTSMAAPHVVATAALILSYGNASTPDEVRAALQETAEDLGASGFDETYGWGLVDAHAALAWDGGTGTEEPPAEEPPTEEPTEIEVFFDSFETGEWNGLWTEDRQNDWFRSTERFIDGNYSAEVDGRAQNAALTSAPIDLQSKTNALITFFWYIGEGLDKGEYLAFDVSTDGGSSWTEKASLKGNNDTEDVWQAINVDLTDISQLQIRFRGKMSRSDESANVDMVKITAW